MKTFLLILNLFVCCIAISQTTLERGDIMILGVNNNYQSCTSPADNAKSVIYLVAFKDITNGTTIDFTDNGWERSNPGFFGTTEGVYRITRTGGTLLAGTVIRVGIKNNTSNPQTPIIGWSVTSSNGLNSFDIAAQDQFFIMQGGVWSSLGTHLGSYSGNLLLGFNTRNVWTSLTNSTNHSGLPVSINCFHLTPSGNSPIRRYSGPTTIVSQGEWLIRILNQNRWTSEGSCDSFDSNFSISNIPIRANIPSQEICSGDNLTNLEVVDETNIVTYQWYRNTTASTIGGTSVGSNSNNYMPSNTLVGTYYYYCVMTIDLPLNGNPNTTDCQFISNFFEVIVNPSTITITPIQTSI